MIVDKSQSLSEPHSFLTSAFLKKGSVFLTELLREVNEERTCRALQKGAEAQYGVWHCKMHMPTLQLMAKAHQ